MLDPPQFRPSRLSSEQRHNTVSHTRSVAVRRCRLDVRCGRERQDSDLGAVVPDGVRCGVRAHVGWLTGEDAYRTAAVIIAPTSLATRRAAFAHGPSVTHLPALCPGHLERGAARRSGPLPRAGWADSRAERKGKVQRPAFSRCHAMNPHSHRHQAGRRPGRRWRPSLAPLLVLGAGSGRRRSVRHSRERHQRPWRQLRRRGECWTKSCAAG
jgi:hypothetical protein